MIHSTAIVHPEARLAADVEIGPYAVIDEHVEIGAGTRIGAHTVITGHTRIGRDNRIFQFASIGDIPQDKKYGGEATRLEIGDRNTIREFTTINVGTAQGGGITRIGNDNWIMAYVHIAHDCIVGNHTIFANCTNLAGHVEVDDYAILGGFTGVHQFCKIGAHVMTAVNTTVFKDIPPYVMAAGSDGAKPHGLNSEGLRRRGFAPEALTALKQAYKTLYRMGLTLEEAKRALAEQARSSPVVEPLVAFLDRSTRGIIR
jgi:UDP-N-acetylglucosamine acyltransferase